MSAVAAVVLSMPKHDLARFCLVHGAELQTALIKSDDGFGKPIDAPLLLWAMAGRESSFGKNLKPRHEPAYDIGGKYADTKALKRCGSAYACSYGPLQIMACNALDVTLDELASEPEKAMKASVDRLRMWVIGRQKADTIEEICDAWNTGNFRDRIVPHEYIAEVRHYYITEVIG
ncbi:MAG TPA: hypothetical protein VN622_11010 [Clostridia bacterium]|nr:hypothetical protein [Clostridia bacterium]